MKKATLIAALIGIGVTKVNAEKMASLTPDDGTDAMTPDEVTSFTTEFKGIQKDLLKNDPEFVSAIQTSEKAKNFDQFERKMKQTFGLTAEDIKDKKFDEIIALAKEKIGKGTDKTTTELQEQLLALENENKNLKEVEIPKIRSEVENQKRQFEIGEKFKGVIPTKDEKGQDKLRLPLETVHKLVKMDLEEMYDLDFNDKNELTLYVKGSDKKLIAKSADGTKFLAVDEFVNSRLEHHQALVKSNAAPGSKEKEKEKIIEGDTVVTKTPGMLKAEANLEALKGGQTA